MLQEIENLYLNNCEKIVFYLFQELENLINTH